MSKTNCINCGAAKEWDAVKCPFCGTTYFDFTSIDFTKQEPVACQFAVPVTYDGKTYCRARDIVKVNTSKGWQLAVCQCDEFKLRDNLIQLFDTSV